MSRWITLVSSLGLESASGASYAFGVYSDQLKNTTGFNQDEIQTVASVGNVGLYFAVIAGVCFDKVGPCSTLVAGIVLSVGGYLAMWAAARGYGLSRGVLSMSIYCFIWSNGSSWFDTVAISANIRNFPNDRGRVTGLLKAFYGLCASLITVIYASFFKSESPDEALDILLFLAAFSGAMGLIGAMTIKLAPPSQTVPISGPDARLMSIGMLLLLLLAVFITVVTVLTNDDVIPARAEWPSYLLVPLVLSQGVLLVPAFRKANRPGGGGGKGKGKGRASTTANSEAAPLLKGEDDDKVVAAGSSLLEIVTDVNFWILTIVMLCGTGAGLTVINNIAQHIKALRGVNSSGDANLYIVILSVGNCTGRLLWGFASDRFPQINRAGWLSIIAASSAGAMLVCAYADLQLMYFGALWSGLSYGGFWAVVPAILADLYGTKWYAAVYSLISIFPALGGYLLSAQLTGKLYDAEVALGDSDCYGTKCFRTAYTIIGLLCAGSVPVGLILTRRIRVSAAPSALNDTHKAVIKG